MAQYPGNLGVRSEIPSRAALSSTDSDARRGTGFANGSGACKGLADRCKPIGILGFSAGGHLASTLGTHFDSGKAEAKDEIERVSSRPDLMILIYPVITMGDFAHKGSKLNLIGENPSPDLVKLYSNELHVTKDTPPAFLAHAVTDPGVPVENSLMFADALRKAGVPFELHLYEQGPHGFGLAPNNPILASWTERCADWLRVHGFAKPRSNATVN